MSSSTEQAQAQSQTPVLTGCVKWFRNDLNYGFITVLTDGEHHNKDIFCHQSNIKTKKECFRTLYTGECVQFEITKSDNEKHPYHGVNISGFNGCMLHCENPNFVRNKREGGDSSRGRGGGGQRDGGNRGRGGSSGRGGNGQGRGDGGRRQDSSRGSGDDVGRSNSITN